MSYRFVLCHRRTAVIRFGETRAASRSDAGRGSRTIERVGHRVEIRLRPRPSLWSNTPVGFIPDSQHHMLRVLAARLVPESARLPGEGHQDMMTIIDDALAGRSARMRRQFSLFLKVLRLAPIARYGRRFDRLTQQQQDSVLRWFQDFPVQIVRSGFWGVRTLVMMSYYTRPEVGASIGYHPVSDGNAVLHARSRR
jgi:hypothetical protein